MNRLLIVSNRLPISITKQKGEYSFQRSAGGLATGVGSFYKSYESLWIGWPGVNVRKNNQKEKDEICEALSAEQCHPVFLSPYDIRNYYDGFCNNTIWPLFHYFNHFAEYDKHHWNVYKKVNESFCEAVLEVARPDDTIWVHDYHLMLLPQMLREELPDAAIGFFLHIPFPSYEIFRLLPWRKEILEGLLGSDLVGFHTYDYLRHFLSSIRRILGYEHTLGDVTVGNRTVRVDMFPMGIDYQQFAEAAESPAVQEEIQKAREQYGDRTIVLSFDRLDYTKGIPLRLEAFDTLLEKKPEYQGNVSLILVAVPSRTAIEQYQALKQQIDELVGRINGKYGTTEWLPVRYFYNYLPFEVLVANYKLADVALVTPLRDGMNLMAKEFVATKTEGKGVLILSEMAGAAPELGEAVIVNPSDRDAVMDAIETAMAMSEEEQSERNRIMQKRLQRYDITHWAADFINRLDDARLLQEKRSERILTAEMRRRLIADYGSSANRLILLDYDGTLVPFAAKPEKATPSSAAMDQLARLAAEPENEVVVISGRDRHTLESWFKTLDLSFIAEHGVWIKERGQAWMMPEALSSEWKEEIFPLLELYADRTPGAFVEEKEYSVVWHYRKADPVLGSLRAKELKDDLLHLTANLNIAVMEGNKVIEVKNAMINKGRAALHWTAKKPWEFIMAIGDDRTDEDLFEVLGESDYSLKVGQTASRARFNLPSQRDVLPLLRECTNCDEQRERGKAHKSEKKEKKESVTGSAPL
ncbi:bifunctional alpha,alpha-trehalose-phosphate synthase (UDP-forming)/trehalose-phosphatase [Methanoculleus sp. FWC-SCC1]|uniref:Alpha,alpha-trehalose-phosphate synthase n=1 Tax=Methanoculleus frigidifontis TaxID=2584085 RepID=A0ABT8MAS8_9EURY|nr:bifunctional alpha,alpha-trehalose-phosphate synthase (UDP-forming)/trehalose-phosphatase [Methanoculleus sp. FWC-SCC1]MDN7025019.1 bifunctional alpha,alpha-trehalose-phosphate synthase (UDP-forming)/trehalose-phosphatase [Methanoculleus sp. FWC-SCC1]